MIYAIDQRLILWSERIVRVVFFSLFFILCSDLMLCKEVAIAKPLDLFELSFCWYAKIN